MATQPPPPPEIDSTALLERWAAGDKKAGNTLLEHHFKPLHRFLANKVPERDLVDVIQDTLLACLAAKANFRGESSFRTFLFSVARNTLFHYYRRLRRKEGRLDPLTDTCAEFADPTGMSTHLARRREQERLLAALREIPLDHQMVLELHCWEGLRAGEIARVLDVPESTIKGRLHRAKKALKVALDATTGTPDELRSITSAMASWILGIHDHIRQDSPEAQRIIKDWNDADLPDPSGA